MMYILTTNKQNIFKVVINQN